MKDGMIGEIIGEGPCPVRVFHPFNVGGACGGGKRGVGCLLCLLFLIFALSHVWFHNPKLAGNLESKVGIQSGWGPSCGCNINLGPNLRKEAQLQTSNFAKLGSGLGSKSDYKLCYVKQFFTAQVGVKIGIELSAHDQVVQCVSFYIQQEWS